MSAQSQGSRGDLGKAPDLPILERFALAVLRRSPAHPPVAGEDDPIHVLNPDEQRALKRITRGAVLRAILAGALSGAASAAAAIWAHRYIGPDGFPNSPADAARFWGVVGSATLVASIFEIGFLYWDALTSVHRMATAAGLKLSAEELSLDQRDIALALARAALELPNPRRAYDGVDPHRESVLWLIALSALIYKGKIVLTNVSLKALLRSILARTLATKALELVTIPVTAIWNGVVVWLIVREARIRVMGPSAAAELVAQAVAEVQPSPAGREAALRAVASAIVRTQDFHPNHFAVLRALGGRAGLDISELDDPRRFVEQMASLSAGDQRFGLRVLVIAAVLDGRLTRAERRLLTLAFTSCGRSLDLVRVERLRRMFTSGRGLDYALVREISDAVPSAAG